MNNGSTDLRVVKENIGFVVTHEGYDSLLAIHTVGDVWAFGSDQTQSLPSNQATNTH